MYLHVKFGSSTFHTFEIYIIDSTLHVNNFRDIQMLTKPYVDRILN